jgi:hypothetical protein
VSAPGEISRPEEVIGRLRELYEYAEDDDRRRAALLLGLAIADRAAMLPDSDAGHGELARQGSSLLDESGEDSPSVREARESLDRSRQLSQGPDTFLLRGGDLNWDVDWEALRGPSEAAANMRAMLPMLASMFPAQSPLRQALTDFVEVSNAIDRGQWTPASDVMLKKSIEQFEQADLDPGLGMVLRFVALFVRVQRCRLAEQAGGHPVWPPLADIDALITEFETTDLLDNLVWGPFPSSMEGFPHYIIAFLLTVRLLADIRSPDIRRDAPWRDNVLQLLARADEHFDKAPPAYAGLVRQMRDNLAQPREALRQWQHAPSPASPPPRTTPIPRPGPAPAAAQPPATDPATARPSLDKVLDEVKEGVVVDGPATPWFSLSGPFGQFATPAGLAGVRLLAQASENPVLMALTRVMSVFEAAVARRWTEAAEREVAELERQAEQDYEGPDSALSERAKVKSMLAVAHVVKWQLCSQSPRLDERPSAREAVGLVTEMETALDLMKAATAEYPDAPGLDGLQGILHMMVSSVLTDIGRPGGPQPDAEMIRRSREHLAQVPPSLAEQLPPVVQDVFLLQELIGAGRQATEDEAARLAGRFGEVYETSGIALLSAETAVAEVRRSPTLASLGVALGELNQAGVVLPAGHPLHFRRLILLAEMQTLLACHSTDPLPISDAIGTTIDAGQIASTVGEQQSAARRLVLIFSAMVTMGHGDGPFDQAEEFFRSALAGAADADWALRVTATVGLGAVAGLRAAQSGDQQAHDLAERLIADAETLLPPAEVTNDWYAAAHALYLWTSTRAMRGQDAGLLPVALRVTDRLDEMLVSYLAQIRDEGENGEPAAADPFAAQLKSLRDRRALLLAGPEGSAGEPGPASTTRPGGPDGGGEAARRVLDRLAATAGFQELGRETRRGRSQADLQDKAMLESAITDLHSALSGIQADNSLRGPVDEALGRCAAELYWSWPDRRTMDVLREAIVHLNRAVTVGARQLPSPERADLLDLLACCRHEVALRHEVEAERVQARIEADRAARAAIRELARCVLLAEHTGQALSLAARANESVARNIEWCLADGNDRAAVEIAEVGRGLVLMSVVLAGHVEEVLRGAGEHDVADAWRQGTKEGRLAALDALWRLDASTRLLASPTVDQLSVMLTATGIDALVYLSWPAGADSDSPGHAVLVRSLTSQVEVLALPGLAGSEGEPLAAYLAALDGALTSFDADAMNEEGFRGGPGGLAWADALIELGSWTHDNILGPLIEHVRGWDLDHRPHLALIPLGELAVIPYAAAWTQDQQVPGSRRYAIEDVTLTYAASARLLAEVSRRPRQPLSDRVVLVSDPTGEFPMSRVAARLLAKHQYPRAEVYGLKNAPCGPATAEVVLAALPGADRPGASLLHLVTHGEAEPVPRLQAYGDDWLRLGRILEQARDRSPEAPGGLVITNACLTDSTRANYDESMTLATAFLAAGACSVIGTRWPVDDDTTAALSLRLHYHLQMGRSPAEALRRAQLDLLRPSAGIRKSLGPHLEAIDETRLSHPASWAGYVHHGSDTRETS